MKIDAKKIMIIAIAAMVMFALALVISFTLLKPKQIEVNFLTTVQQLDGSEQSIASAAGIEGSVLFFSRKNAKSKLEKQFAYLKVVGFEVRFPNTVIIHAAERESLYAVRLSAFSYAMVDHELKVLSKTETFVSSPVNEILLNITVINTTAKVGEFLDVSSAREKNVANQLKNALLRNNRDTISSKASFKSISFQIEVIEGTQVSSLQLLTQDFLDFETTIYQAESFLPEKLECYFRSKSALEPNELLTKAMAVIETTDRGIVAVLID